MSSLPEADRRALLALARQAIEEIILRERILDIPAPEGNLAERAGVFVTLHRRGRLRGCIGHVENPPALASGVVQSAIAAARSDPRFPPVEPEEIPELEIEISVLSPMAPIRPQEVEPGRHGLMVVCGALRGLLLPQVPAKYGWSRDRFVQETCVKAGLPGDAWKSAETKLFGFTAEVFSEREFATAATG